jgi:hypothetical protein
MYAGIGKTRGEVEQCAINRETEAAADGPKPVDSVRMDKRYVYIVDRALVESGFVGEPAKIGFDTINEVARLPVDAVDSVSIESRSVML